MFLGCLAQIDSEAADTRGRCPGRDPEVHLFRFPRGPVGAPSAGEAAPHSTRTCRDRTPFRPVTQLGDPFESRPDTLVSAVSGTPVSPSPLAVVRALPTHRSDTEIVAGLRDGAQWAQSALFDRYAPDVERVLRRVLGNDRHTELADVVHDTFVQAFASVHKLRDAEALRAWIRSIATFTAFRTIRSRTRRRWLRFYAPEELPEPANEANPEAREACQRTYWVLDRMQAEERVPFALRYIEGCEIAEVAALCDASISTVKRRLRRAEQRFAQLARGDDVLRHWFEEGGRWTR